jgi:hypothetical protein
MKVIDCHTHCFPDDLAEKAVARLTSAYQLVPSFDGTVCGLIGQMDEAGIEASVIVPVATKPSQVQSINDWIAGIRHPRVIGFGAMHPDLPDIREETARIAALGIRGIKLHANWQRFRPDDPKAYPMYEAAIEQGMIVYFHGGDELEPWPEEILATPRAFAQVRRSFPELKMIVAHLGGYLMWDAVEEHLLGSDVYLDMSACFPEDLPDDRYLALMRAHGIQKILFASDSPCGPPIPQLRRLLSLLLTDEEKEMVCWGNAAKLLGLS